MFFFFFKRKTAYEMRISDWSSDVCSSDLGFRRDAVGGVEGLLPLPAAVGLLRRRHEAVGHLVGIEHHAAVDVARGAPDGLDERGGGAQEALLVGIEDRSEEHTSELQSLMRISYAVFCLKKNKRKREG